ncbi:hypothetical protein SAMN05216428_101115 [Nitrosospira sp. Nsp11]|uniref:hypothetical protein n=1 Tax=Nitrosospira sp. Nsp11 TaxID=1855338 RepID=UPI00091CEE19|nr:hypothetical protein [Nitrosospira sp. Nsp11]SHL11339.1 hypothetical protein SAMN05216428_101115 [Nitrosospira sp. Nsp11]
MSESTQIVRQLQRGEFPPAYSTDELMLGVCHIVRTEAPRAKPELPPSKVECKRADNTFDPETAARMLSEHKSNRMIAWSMGLNVAKLTVFISNDKRLRDLSVARKGCAVSVADRNFDTIKRMLIAGEAGEDIGIAVGLEGSTVRYYVNTVDELRKIHRERGRIGGKAHASKKRFLEKRAAIYRALQSQSITSVSERFGFRPTILRKHLAGDEKEAKS